MTQRSPKEVADDLTRTHGHLALLYASLHAFDAIKQKDMSLCVYWDKVLKILERKTDPVPAKHQGNVIALKQRR